MPADSNGNVLERCLYHLEQQGHDESSAYAICLKPEKGLRSKYPKVEKWVHKAPSEKKDVKLDNIRPGKKWHEKNKKKKSTNDLAHDVMAMADDDPFRILISACITADDFYKNNVFNKNAGTINALMVKSLKIAQKIIKGLIVKYPFKGLICYNTMKKLLKELET